MHDCAIAERKARLASHRLANGDAVDTAALAIARGRVFAMRWRAQDTIVRAGMAFLTLSAEIDQSGMTAARKLDLLGCRHRCWALPEFVEFARLVGDGWEVAPLDWHGTADPRMGLLKVCTLPILDASFLERHAALLPAVHAIEKVEAGQQQARAETAHVAARVAAAAAIAFAAPTRLQ